MSWWSVAFQALGSAIGGSSARKESKKDRKAAQREAELAAANRRRELEAARRYDLEDRRYKEEAIGGYRQFAPAGIPEGPEYSSTEPTPIGLPTPIPTNERPRNGQTGLMFYR